MDDELGLLVSAATDAAARVDTARDYRKKFTHIGVGLIHALCAVAVSLARFARAVHPQEKP